MKCKFDERKNFVRAFAVYMAADASDEATLNAVFAEAFTNPEDAKAAVFNRLGLNALKGEIPGEGSNPDPDSKPNEEVKPPIDPAKDDPVKHVDTTGNTIVSNIDSDNMSACYQDAAAYTRMQIEFQSKMLKSSILDIDKSGSECYVDPNAVDDTNHTTLQSNIIKYKNELIHTIEVASGKTIGRITLTTSDVEYTDIINKALETFSNEFIKDKAKWSKAELFDAYMILKNFDALIRQLVPYVNVDKSYESQKLEGVTKYSFMPTVKHRKNFSKNEMSDITKQMGNLAETILKVIPDIDANGRKLSSCIGVTGFNGAMQLLKTAVMQTNVLGEDSANFRRTITKGAGALLDPNEEYNLNAMIDAFIKSQSGKGDSITGEFRQIFIHNKLRGIQAYLFRDDAPSIIKNMFAQLFLKTELSNYRIYTVKEGKLEGSNLKSTMYATQKNAFEDIIRGGLKRATQDGNLGKKLITDKYVIAIKGSSDRRIAHISPKDSDKDSRTLTITYDFSDAKNLEAAKFSDDSDPTLLSEFMIDAFGYYIPDTYATCIVSNDSDTTNWINDFASYTALMAEAVQDSPQGAYSSFIRSSEIDLRNLKNIGLKVGQRLGTIFGDSIRSTMRGVNGNSLPLYGLTSLAYNWMSILDDIANDNDSMQQYGLFGAQKITGEYANADLITGTFIRNQIQLNGVTKDPTELNANELNRLAILSDFWFQYSDTSQESMFLQSETLSDKERHFLYGYNLDKALGGITLEPYFEELWGKRSVSLREMIKDAVVNGNKKLNTFTRYIRRDKYNTAALNILQGYESAGILAEGTVADIKKLSGDTRAQKIVETLKNLDDYLVQGKYTLEVVQENFIEKGVNFTLETLKYFDSLIDQGKYSPDFLRNQLIKKGVSFTKETFNYLNDLLVQRKYTLDSLRNKFIEKGIDFTEETYATAPKAKGIGKVRINETLIAYCDYVSSQAKWDAFMTRSQEKFAKDINKLGLSGLDSGCGNQVSALLSDATLKLISGWKKKKELEFYNPNTQVYKMVNAKGELHPIAAAYFSMDILLSQEYNSLTTGEVWAHANKNKDLGKVDGEYVEFSEASRLVNKIKRSVIYGSTIHEFGQGLKDDEGYECGVTEDIDIAIIKDPKAFFYTVNTADSVDPQDGSGWCTAVESKLENNSLADAEVGDNKKTIIHSIDPKTGTPTLLKWAVYSLTNAVRRRGFGSTFNVENLVKRMYNKPLNLTTELDLHKIYEDYVRLNGPIYVYNPTTCDYQLLKEIQNLGGNRFRQIFASVDSNENIIKTTPVDTQTPINTLYNIDQLFGGAWTAKRNSDGTFMDSEDSVELLTKTVIRYNLRDKQIAYAVNASACKVGATNLNSADKWEDGDLTTYKISTKYGGVLMDADHALDEAEVTEMSQMISALIEDGHYTDLVLDIYNYIGDIATKNPKVKKSIDACEALKKATTDEEKENARKTICRIIGQSLMDSFSSGKNTIGLAQAFCSRAATLQKSQGGDLNIPFDDATLWGAVVADITSTLNKQAIRRKHPGFAGVLNPSHNMIMYYRSEGGTKLFKEFNQECKEKLLGLVSEPKEVINPNTKLPCKTWAEVAANVFKLPKPGSLTGETIINPFCKLISAHEVDFEDTVFVPNPDGTYEPTYIDTFDKYDQIRNLQSKGTQVYINTARPKNLRGCDTLFNVVIGNTTETMSLYNLDSVRAAHYLEEDLSLKTPIEKQQIILKVLGQKIPWITFATVITNLNHPDPEIRSKYKQQYKQICSDITQDTLELLDESTKAYKERSDGQNTVDPAYLLSSQSYFDPMGVGLTAMITEYHTRPAEIITGRYGFDKLGITRYDNIADIKSSEFFKNRLWTMYGKYASISVRNAYNENNLTLEEQQKVYDKVLFHNGQPILVKIGDIGGLNEKLQKSPLVEYNQVGDDFRIGAEVVVSNDDKFNFEGKIVFETINTNEGVVPYITILGDNVHTAEQVYKELEKRTEYFDDIEIDSSDSINSLNKHLDRVASDRYAAFTKMLKMVGARIPTQAMQSFMPFQIIAFADTDQNVVYVPKANTAIEGSDYDIDKLYLLAASVRENGMLTSGTYIQRNVGFDVAVELHRPDENKKFKEGAGRGINNQLLEQMGFDLTAKPGEYKFKFNDPEKGEIYKYNFIKEFNRIYDQEPIEGGIPVAFDPDVTPENRKKFIDLLNDHSDTKPNIKNSEEALRMKMFQGIYKITTLAQNQIKAQITVDTCTGELKDRAAKTTSGDAEKHISAYNPASKYTMQVQNMLGKAVVGIGAVSLKTYFLMSSANNRIVSSAVKAAQNGDWNSVLADVNALKIYRPNINGEMELTTISNTNLKPLIRALESGLRTIVNQPELQVSLTKALADVKVMQANTASVSAPEFLSGIISLAADNAKDLALPKLNATSDLVDIYTTAAMIGIPFSQMADIMTSPLFNWMTENGAQNIFDESTLGLKVKDMIKFLKLTEFKHWKDWEIKRVLTRYDNWVDSYERKIAWENKKNGTHNTSPYPRINFKGDAWIEALNDPIIINRIIEMFETTWEKREGQKIHKKDADGKDLRDENGKYVYETDENGKIKMDWSTIKVSLIPKEQVKLTPDDEMDMDDSEGSNKTAPKILSQQDWYRLYQGFLRYKERLKYLQDPEARKTLDFLDILLDGVEEMSTIGSMASINQGMKTDISGFYNYTRKISDFITSRMDKNLAKDTASDIGIMWKQEVTEHGKAFEVINDCLLNPEYAERLAKAFETDRQTNGYVFTMFNILNILRLSPNFSAMISVTPTAETMLSTALGRYRIVTSLMDSFKEELPDGNHGKTLSEKDLASLNKYVTDYMIYQFLSNSGIKIDINSVVSEKDRSDLKLYDGASQINAYAKDTLGFETLNDIASFKRLMELYVFPKLLEKYGKNNKFLRDLNIKHDNNADMDVLGLPISLIDAENDVGMSEKYTEYLTAFNSIANEKIGGISVADWFFLYNLICNKNGFGRNSLTKLFEDLVKTDKMTPALEAYYNFLSKMGDQINISPEFKLEAQWYISTNTRGTKVTPPKGINYQHPGGDFTLQLPLTGKLINLKAKEEESTKPIPKIVGEVAPNLGTVSATEFITELVNNLNLKYKATNPDSDLIVLVDKSSEITQQGRFKNANGFVHNGQIYLNVDKFNNVESAKEILTHELMHCALAIHKMIEPEVYYSMISSIREDPRYEQIAKGYEDCVGSDLDEEVYCVISSTKADQQEALIETIQGLDLDTDVFKNYVKGSEKLATVKRRLYNSKDKDNKLEQKCS